MFNNEFSYHSDLLFLWNWTLDVILVKGIALYYNIIWGAISNSEGMYIIIASCNQTHWSVCVMIIISILITICNNMHSKRCYFIINFSKRLCPNTYFQPSYKTMKLTILVKMYIHKMTIKMQTFAISNLVESCSLQCW